MGLDTSTILPPAMRTCTGRTIPGPCQVHAWEVYRFLWKYSSLGCWSYLSNRLSIRLGRPASTTSVGDVFDKIEKALKGNSSKQRLSLLLASTVGALKETGFASPMGEQSYLNLALRSDTKAKGLILPRGEQLVLNGMHKIPQSLQTGIQVHLNEPVIAIQYQHGQIYVTTTHTVYEAQAAVITVPVGVLLRDAICFDPPLTPAYKHAMAMVDMGLLNKVVLRFTRCFWPQDASMFLSAPCPTTQCTWFLNLADTGCPILVGFVGGYAAHKLEQASDTVVIDRALHDLQRIFGSKVASLEKPSVITRWGCDPLAYGSYSRFRAGATGHERRLLSQPIQGTLFLAGEATHPNDPSTLHGAYWSGLRAARQIAGS